MVEPKLSTRHYQIARLPKCIWHLSILDSMTDSVHILTAGTKSTENGCLGRVVACVLLVLVKTMGLKSNLGNHGLEE
jgi:hypothetical protein